MPISKRNRRGVFWLLIIGGVISISPRVLSSIGESEEYSISSGELIKSHKIIVEQKRHSFRKKKKSSRYSVPAKKFDPNDYTLKDWMQIGLSEKQSEVVLKFSERGIRSAEDLEKIFVFPEQLFKLIEDSLVFVERGSNRTIEVKKEERNISVDINKSSQEELENIPGIGPFFAKKIIEHRKELGGYVQKVQLLEIWKFDEEKLQEIDRYIILEQFDVRKININQASIEEFKAHPYISYSLANSFVKYREQNGEFVNLEDCKRMKLINEELYKKLQPYLTTR